MTDFEQLRNKIQEGSATAEEIFIFKMMVDEIVEQEFATSREISEIESSNTQSSLDSFWRSNSSVGVRPGYKKNRQRRMVIVTGLSIIVASLVSGLLYVKNGRSGGATEPPASLPLASRPGTCETYSEINGPSFFVMPDGSEIFIKAGSRISYTDNFKEERALVLHGEAYFDVAHDSLHTFSVRLDDISVKVLGTTFSIRANDGEKSITIRVLHGRVSVHTDQFELAQLNDNEKMTLYRNNMRDSYEGYPMWDVALPFTWEIEKLPAGVDWKGKTKLIFENARFEDIIRRVEQHFGVHIRLKDKSLRDIRITATFSKNISLNSILRDLSLVSSCEINLIQSDPLTIEFERHTSLSLPRRLKIVP